MSGGKKSPVSEVNPALERLLARSAFDFSSASEADFVAAMKIELEHHRMACDRFGRLLRFENYNPGGLTIDTLDRIPHLFVNVFKTTELMSVPEKEVEIVLTSSGTGGQRSRAVLDYLSVARIKKIVFSIFSELGMASLDGKEREEKVNYVLFSYDIKYAPNIGTAFSDDLLTFFTGRGDVWYALQWDHKKKDFYFDLPGTVKALKRFSESSRPLRLLGFPSFMARTLRTYRDYFGKSVLAKPEQSFVIPGGGWKALESEKITPGEFRTLISDVLGIPDSNVRDTYGFVEHGIPYVECAHHHFHVPNTARVFARDPETLAPIGFGKPGMLNFVTPYIHSHPAVSVLSSDIGIVHERCDCGLPGNWISIVGRAGKTAHKGCAMKAEELNK
jgi:hypothetical protein